MHLHQSLEELDVYNGMSPLLLRYICNKKKNIYERMFSVPHDLLCFNNKVVCVIPVSEQVSGLFIVDAYVVITESAWKEVVYLPGNIEDIAHPGEER